MKTKCLNCDNTFDQTEGKRKKIYCSDKCRAAFNQKKKFKTNASHIVGIVYMDGEGGSKQIKTLDELKGYLEIDADLSKYAHIFNQPPSFVSDEINIGESHQLQINRHTYIDGEKSYNNPAIQKEIDDIRKEKIPDNRNTIYGRKVWQQEQDAKINKLKKQLK